MKSEDRELFIQTDLQIRQQVRNQITPLMNDAVLTLREIITRGEDDKARVEACKLVVSYAANIPFPQDFWPGPCPEPVEEETEE